MEYKLKDLIDIPRLQSLLDSLDAIYSMPSAIIDTESNILTATAWQDICTKFHRINPQTLKCCKESDAYLMTGLEKKAPQIQYKCPQGLVDTATPIIVDGRHLGNVFTGQLFTEPPDEEFFKKQAKKYGFDEKKYIEALRKVPIVSQDRLNKNLQFLGRFTEMLAEQGMANKRRQEDHDRLFTVLNSIDAIVYVADMETCELLFVNDYLKSLFGNVIGKICWQTIQQGQDGPCPFCTNDKLIKRDGEPTGVYQWELCNTRINRWFRCRDRAIRWTDGRLVRLEIATDFTEEKIAEDELKKHRENLEELVKERTAELNIKNEELEKFNKLFVGRELRMIELKKKITELEKKTGSSENAQGI